MNLLRLLHSQLRHDVRLHRRASPSPSAPAPAPRSSPLPRSAADTAPASGSRAGSHGPTAKCNAPRRWRSAPAGAWPASPETRGTRSRSGAINRNCSVPLQIIHARLARTRHDPGRSESAPLEAQAPPVWPPGLPSARSAAKSPAPSRRAPSPATDSKATCPHRSASPAAGRARPSQRGRPASWFARNPANPNTDRSRSARFSEL